MLEWIILHIFHPKLNLCHIIMPLIIKLCSVSRKQLGSMYIALLKINCISYYETHHHWTKSFFSYTVRLSLFDLKTVFIHYASDKENDLILHYDPITETAVMLNYWYIQLTEKPIFLLISDLNYCLSKEMNQSALQHYKVNLI